MEKLYLLIGKHNIDAWDRNEPNEIELDDVKEINFCDKESRGEIIDIMCQFILEDYICLDEDEYNFLKN